MAAWNLAVVLDAIARETPDREAVVHGARRITWQEFASRARALAWYLHTEAGLAPGDKVAIVLPNCPEYLETFFATRKLHCVPLNIGIGSSLEALHRMIDATDAKAIVCSPVTAQAAQRAIRRIPKRWRPLIVEVGGHDELGMAAAVPPLEWEIETPSADDVIILATHHAVPGRTEFGAPLLPVAPFGHGNGLAAALGALSRKGSVVFVDSAVFDPLLVWRTVEKECVVTLTIGGDSFARPLLAALPTATRGRSLTTLRTISSSGARLSPDVANGLRAALGDVTVLDAYEETEPRAPGAQPMIQPSEVEARLRKHSSITDCVVVGISDPRIGKIVVAVVQISEDHYLDAPELSAWCRANLPSTLTPGRFVFVEKIERSPSGRADYEGLRALAIDALVAQTVRRHSE